jgi:EAL domain-containing protein (putative c-di-GMP-specific phosphodiesterase class I)
MRTIPISDPTQVVARFVRGSSNAPTNTFEILQTPFTVGRSDDCDLTLDSAKVSREHALVRRDANGFYLRDNRSTNGTFVNGEKVTEARLNDGDQVTFANIELIFLVSGASEEAQVTTQHLSVSTCPGDEGGDPASMIHAIRSLREAIYSGGLRFSFQPIVELATDSHVAIDLSVRQDSLSSSDRWVREVEARGTALWHAMARWRSAEQAARYWPGQWLIAKVESQEVGRQDVIAGICDLQCRVASPIVAAMPDGSVADIPFFREFIATLREAGIRIAYDGFARGGAQLANLVAVAPDFVRLSPSLARGIDRAAERRNQLQEIVRVAKEKKFEIIATGVHHEDEAATCRELGIQYAQGNHFAGVQPLDSLPDF